MIPAFRPRNRRPMIGVTTSRRSGWRIFPLVAFNIWMAGGRAVRWDTRRDVELHKVDGVVIGGGDDISPDVYGGRLLTSAQLDPDRDAMERDLVEKAYITRRPILGICRGAQMLNVALGGTLDQDAYGTYEKSDRHWTVLPRKTVCLQPGTRLRDLVGPGVMKVNALHSQSVDALGDGLRVAARDMGGMVQAIERVREPFATGVQWHPEHLFYAHRQQRIFRALVQAALARRLGQNQLSRIDRLETGNDMPAGLASALN